MTSEDAATQADVLAQPQSRAGRNGRQAATIYDIAKLAGVSPSTVSRALNKPGRINIKTEERIHAAAKQLKYRLNPMARALPTGRTNTLGMLLADITNPVFSTVVRGAQREAAERGFTLIIAESQESGQREVLSAGNVLPSVDGIILVGARMSDEEIKDFAEQKPLVVINRFLPDVETIIPDLDPGIDQALAHLADLGHSSIAFLAGPTNSWMSGARSEALRKHSERRGLTLTEIGPGVPTLDGGRAAFPRVVATGVTAVVAYNDLMAIGLLRAAQEADYLVPGRLSIVGFDDIFGSDFTSPPLTTVRTPLALMGELAVRRILAMVGSRSDGDSPSGASSDLVNLTTELIIRRSSGRAAR
ncbi:MAG TPA: LacI family DNA-binding transcriptional regulator [Marisediminicola sp.]|nr:LacI family DNA-binding transcriptional regulator [Marisediminicola sp.]